MKKIVSLTLCAITAFALFAGCTTKKDEPAKEVKTADIWTKIEESIGTDNMPGLADMDAEVLKTMYGIDSANLEEFTGKYAMMNVNADEFFIAKVKEGKMDAVKEGIEKRKTDLDNTWKQYLPDVYEIVKASKTIENGSYIIFVVSASADKAETAFADALK